jgi:hypothetical protein
MRRASLVTAATRRVAAHSAAGPASRPPTSRRPMRPLTAPVSLYHSRSWPRLDLASQRFRPVEDVKGKKRAPPVIDLDDSEDDATPPQGLELISTGALSLIVEQTTPSGRIDTLPPTWYVDPCSFAALSPERQLRLRFACIRRRSRTHADGSRKRSSTRPPSGFVCVAD